MTWTKIIRRKRQRDSVTVRIAPAGRDHQPRLFMLIERQLAERAGLPVHDGACYDVFSGDGADAGCIKIVGADDGEFLGRNNPNTLGIVIPPPDGAPEEYPPTPCEAIAEDGGLVFDLPWHAKAARAAETQARPGGRAGTRSRVATIATSISDGPAIGPETAASQPPALTIPLPAGATGATVVVNGRTVSDPESGAPAAGTAPAPEDDVAPPSPAERFAGALHVTSGELAKTWEDIEAAADRPVNGTAREHVYADSEESGRRYEFTHKRKSSRLNKREHALVSHLYDVMLKAKPGSFLAFDTLIAATGVKDKASLQALVSVARKLIEPLSLTIKPWTGMGYWMEEAKA